MYVSEDVDHYGSRLDGLVRQSLDIQESVKSGIAEFARRCAQKKIICDKPWRVLKRRRSAWRKSLILC